MFDEKAQKKLDAMKFKQCKICGNHFLVRGASGTSVMTLKKHMAAVHGEIVKERT